MTKVQVTNEQMRHVRNNILCTLCISVASKNILARESFLFLYVEKFDENLPLDHERISIIKVLSAVHSDPPHPIPSNLYHFEISCYRV